MSNAARSTPKPFIKNFQLADSLEALAECEASLAEQTRRFKAVNDGLERFLRTGASSQLRGDR